MDSLISEAQRTAITRSLVSVGTPYVRAREIVDVAAMATDEAIAVADARFRILPDIAAIASARQIGMQLIAAHANLIVDWIDQVTQDAGVPRSGIEITIGGKQDG